MFSNRPLSGVNVVELSTFVAAACAGRFFADQGADVIKVEPITGDVLRFAATTDGIPEDRYENITFDIENGNKRDIALNLKSPEGFAVFMKLMDKADIFITNFRPQALAKMGLDYETLSKKYPKLIYGSVTGYGEEGPDKDLPGYDATAFFTRSGILGSIYEKGTVPINLVPSMGDRQTGMCLAAGILACLFNAQRTGKGEKVFISLLGTAIYMQATLLQSSQYGKVVFPMRKQDMLNPLMSCYRTKDDRWIQLALPVYNIFMPKFAKAMSREEWITDPRFVNVTVLQSGNTGAFYDSVAERFAELTADEACAILQKADLPHAVAQVWGEVLKDPQAWATNCFVDMEYPSGTRTLVRNPVQFQDAGVPEYKKSPQIGENSIEILKELGYSDDKIQEMLAAKIVRHET